MKKFFLLFYKIFMLGFAGTAQLNIGPGVTWGTIANATVVLQNMDLVNNGNFVPATGSMKFAGNQNSGISGNNAPRFYILEIAKTNGAKVLLNRNIPIGSSLNFISGQLDLNGYNIILTSNAYVAGESETNRIIGPNGGFIELTQDMNAPASVNAGNLGATISSPANLGTVIIRRGHLSQSSIGLANSINRYYTIIPGTNADLNATLRLKYFDAELNGQNENTLVMYQALNASGGWANLSQTSRNTNANYVEKTGIASLAVQTLANDNVVADDGVTGLVFTGQRKKATEVTLKWTSQTETNMSGYQIQRKLDNEADFSDNSFVTTLAANGNSVSQLTYQNIDANSYTGLSYYRLKIITTDNAFTYSDVIAVPGKTKGKGGGNNLVATGDDDEILTKKPSNSMTNSGTAKITVGPNPNNGNFWFTVNGIEKETIATLYTIDGKQINQFRVVNLKQQRVNNLSRGIYLLKVPGYETQKIIVNGGENSGQQSKQMISDNTKL